MLGGNPVDTSGSTSLLYAGEQFDTNAQMYYNRARYYDQNTGRFNRTDPFAGNMQDPQSLHKYLYAHCNPINGIDPTGNYTTTVELNVGLVIGAMVFALAATTVLNPAWREANERLAEALVSATVAAVAALSMSLTDSYEWVKEKIRNITKRFRLKRGNMVYLHYSFISYAPLLVLGGLWPGSWATTDIYVSGWLANQFLSLTGPLRTSVYLVWPKKGFGPTYGGIVPPIPWLDLIGGGTQVNFGFGSGGFGTVFGPIPIPKGTSLW